ncbi:hypothetical protein SCLCIDRAFT_26820 [Scleroderma citrinum Foug A]|uniref:Uncharacterized protein n=1 Tax=Scleroderma citrinum Foug A TaxID=1036808 RepID=A0A0C3DVG8_9AGAM|nr:hypothetical protein SCLCIDRAFT_26820 [Scleroderma citrinum Foug A]
MPRGTKDTEDKTNGDPNTRVLHSHRIVPLLNKFGPARGVVPFKVGLPIGIPCKQKVKCTVEDMEDKDTGESPVTPTVLATCKVKLYHAIQLPEGWEEHMFGLRDQRSLTLIPSARQPALQTLPMQAHQSLEKKTEEDEDKLEDEAEISGAAVHDVEQDLEDNAMARPGDEDMSSQDGSNYSADVRGAKGKKVAQGSAPSDDHSSLPPSSPPADSGDSDTKIDVDKNTSLRCKKSKTHQSRKEANAMTVKPGGVSGRGNNEPQVPKKPDTLSNAALEEIRSFSDEVKVKAEELGQQLGKSAQDILVAAGFGVKPSHNKVNDVNLFHSWYWVTQPKPEGASRNEFNDTITKEYNELMKDIPKDDVAVRRKKLKCVYEWQETSTVVPSNKSVKSIATRLENAKVQFSGLAESWSNLKEIEIVGVLISNMVRQFINERAIDLHALMDKYTAIFKNGDGSTTGLIGNSGSSVLDPALEL